MLSEDTETANNLTVEDQVLDVLKRRLSIRVTEYSIDDRGYSFSKYYDTNTPANTIKSGLTIYLLLDGVPISESTISISGSLELKGVGR